MKYFKKLVWIVMIMISLGNPAVVMASGLAGLNMDKLPEWGVKKSSLGGKLLLSDSPEMVLDDGILYQDKVEGKVRLFFYHVNSAADAKKMDVVLENKGHEDAHVTVSQSSMREPGFDWLTVGKEAMRTYLEGKGAFAQITIPPGGTMSLSPSISETAVLPNMLINGIFDFVTDRSVTVKVMMLPVLQDSISFSKTARTLPADQPHMRGTFEGANRQISSMHSYDGRRDGVVGLTLADNENDFYLHGIDAIDEVDVMNYGNYGVVYQIVLPSKKGGKIAYYLAPMGGSYAGAIGINHPDVSWSPLATPMDRLFAGNKSKNDLIFLGTYDSGDLLSFTFSPPGGSNLPVKMVILPQ